MRSPIPPVFVPCVLASTDCSVNATKEHHVTDTRLILTVHLEGAQQWSLNNGVETRNLKKVGRKRLFMTDWYYRHDEIILVERFTTSEIATKVVDRRTLGLLFGSPCDLSDCWGLMLFTERELIQRISPDNRSHQTKKGL